MSVNLIAILLSLAMMITGAGSEGRKAEEARSLLLHNVTVTYNGETVRLAPQAHLGVSAREGSAVYAFGIDLEDQTLLPVQIGVNDEGITALFAGSDVAVKVTSGALEGLIGRLSESVQMSGDVQVDGNELLRFMTEKYLPAYGAMMGLMQDSEQMALLQQSAEEVYDRTVERGEGVPTTVEIDGESYEALAYSYDLDSEDLGKLCDAVYASDPVLSDYSDAVFGLYAMMPEEWGLSGVTNFTQLMDLMDQMGMYVTMDIDESRTEDGAIDVMDATLSMEMPALESAEEPEDDTDEEAGEDAAEEEEDAAPEIDEDAEPEGDAADGPEPVVWRLHQVQTGEEKTFQGSLTFDVDEERSFEMTAEGTWEEGALDVYLTLEGSEGERVTERAKASLFLAPDGAGGAVYSTTLHCIVQDVSDLNANVFGSLYPDGTAENSFSMELRTPQVNGGLSFDLDVTADPIADAANGHETACVLDDLSEEGLKALESDPTLSALLLKVGTSVSADVSKLTGEASVQDATALIRDGRLPIDVDDLEEEDDLYADFRIGAGEAVDSFSDSFAYEGFDETMDLDMGNDAVEDDGELAFPQPRLGWLPEGWRVTETNVDTAYDWVEVYAVDEAGQEVLYAAFFQDEESADSSFIVGKDGSLSAGREVDIADLGEDTLSVLTREGNVMANLILTGANVDNDTIARMVAGIEF